MAWLITPSIWNYRKSKNIYNNTSTSLNNYQMMFTLYYGSGTDSATEVYLNSHANTNFSDVRFTDTDGTTLLNYWFESLNNGISATVWIKIPSIPPSGNPPTNVYVYYGNNSQTISTSNGVNTFEFFDDFLGTSLDTSKWTYGGGGGSVSVSNGEITLTSNGQYVTTIVRSLQLYTPSTQKLAFRVRAKSTNINPVLNMKFGITSALAPSNGVVFIMAHDAGDVTLERPSIDTGFSDITNYHIYELRTTASSTTYLYIDNILKATKTDVGTGSDYLCVVGVDSYTSSINITAKADWILVRKYQTQEPTWALASSEQTYTANLTVSSIPSGAEIYLNGGDVGQTTTYIFPPLYPGTYDVLLKKVGYQNWWSGYFTLDTNQTRVVTGDLAIAQITATAMTLDKSSVCIAPCIVTANITWNNPGPIASFEPAIVVNGVRTGSGLTIVLDTGQNYQRSFAISLGVGSNDICPEPN